MKNNNKAMAKNKLISPFVKWVGGKRQLMDAIMEAMPKNISNYTYVEPFLGGGAVLFHIQPKNAIVNDFNSELINVYNVVKENLDELIADLKKHRNESEYFYHIRSLDRSEDFAKTGKIQRASRLIYLNKTCYNGLYRVNNAGEFNSPFGRYKNPNIINEPVLRAVSSYLNSNNIQILSGDYDDVLKNLDKNSFVYLDPPYHPISESSNFTGYIQGGWNIFDQVRLRKACDELTKKGVKFLLSNSASGFIKDQYRNYNISIVKATRSINVDAGKRGEVEELLIRNYE
ncbi:MAG: DNA adenine methylase [Dysgonamonadaceae bacterium]|jgi:DNA adenine methylase|nr:DNA adenine methylase [Dysgonamonadaceae bacterium]